ncbi:hypothetical protein Q3G72_020559 [Acer saccharum]|nr:hypothetical protein Q3G72_020559 [Acer saccharum]
MLAFEIWGSSVVDRPTSVVSPPHWKLTVCAAFVWLIEVRPSFLEDYILMLVSSFGSIRGDAKSLFNSVLKNFCRLIKLSASGDEAWKAREAAVLALAAIAEDCNSGLYPHFSEYLQLEQMCCN